MIKWIKTLEKLPIPGKNILFWEKWNDVPCVGFYRINSNGFGEWIADRSYLSVYGDGGMETSIVDKIEYWAELPNTPY
jgi:hypothetical protein